MIRILVLMALCLLGTSSCTSYFSGAQNSARESYLGQNGYSGHQIKSQWGDQRYWIKAYIANTAARLLLDSGANSTDVKQEFADKVKLSALSNVEVVSKGALGREMKSHLTLAPLTLGTQTFSQFPLVISEHKGVKSAVSSYDGQLGLDALHHSSALLDISAEMLWVPFQNKGNTSQLNQSQLLGLETLKLKSARNYPHLILESKSRGRTLRWIIDSGAEVSLLDSNVALSMGLTVVETGSKMIDVAGDSSPLGFTVVSHQLFGRYAMLNMRFAVADLGLIRDSFQLSGGQKIDGILGIDFLTETQALLDISGKRIFIGRPQGIPTGRVPSFGL